MAINQMQAAQLRRAITKRVQAEIDLVNTQEGYNVGMEEEEAKRKAMNTRLQLESLITKLTIFEVVKSEKPKRKPNAQEKS